MNEEAAYKCELSSDSEERIMFYKPCPQWCHMKNKVDIFTNTKVTLWYLAVVGVFFFLPPSCLRYHLHKVYM